MGEFLSTSVFREVSFSEYKSSYSIIGKKKKKCIHVCVCVCVYTCLLNHLPSRRVTVFFMLTPRWFLVKETEFAFSSPSQKVRLLVFFHRLIWLVEFNQFTSVREFVRLWEINQISATSILCKDCDKKWGNKKIKK